MATSLDDDDDLNIIPKFRWTENSIVYKRRFRNNTVAAAGAHAVFHSSEPLVDEVRNEAEDDGVVKPLVIPSVDDRIRLNLRKETPRNEIRGLKRKLHSELEQVSSLVSQLEAKIASYSSLTNSSHYLSARSDVVDRRLLVRVNSDMGAARNIERRPYNRQLSVAVMENSRIGNEFVEKEKRTPKANQFYRNSEFLLGNDRLPCESNKRSKTNNGRKDGGERDQGYGYGFGFDKSMNQVFKNCSSVLQRLMKHKHGWVFNEPVNAEALGLVDYHDIIKHPMDLGTIKTRLSQNWYKSPRDFAEDVRLVFRNAMTYNPKGQDVHVMAEQLLQIFEERWTIIEAEFNSYWKYPMYNNGSLPTPTSRRAYYGPPLVSAPAAAPISLYAPQTRTFDRPNPVNTSMAIDPKFQRPHVGRTSVSKKPKAKDPNKRDMTYDEKQKLSNNLQGLPPEKLDAIVQIIKKRSTALSQQDDEIEVDIDTVDAETLWELDRFVSNYRKNLSKKKRKAELALQGRTGRENVALTTPVQAATEGQIDSGAALENSTDPPAEGENRGYNGSRSSSSSSSTSDSGSSSSGLDVSS